MNKTIMELEKIFEKKYLEKCTNWQALRVKNLLNELICLEEEIKQTKKLDK